MPLATLEAQAEAAGPVRGFARRCGRSRTRAATALIAEIKKASPSKGLIRADFDPPALARAYAAGGADLPVGPDRRPVLPGRAGVPDRRARRLRPARPAQGLSLRHLPGAEARAWGADCILVIMAAVDDALAVDLVAAAASFGMDALIEVHDEAELDRALRLPSPLVGINNRDLRSFEVSLATTERLAPRIPADRLVVGESGLFTPADLARLARIGVSTFLIGESLMREADVAAATRALLARPALDAAE
jgi:indole-3-glycerol phosphate synthase